MIVAHRYGWVPPGQPEGEGKSITWLECEEAGKAGKEIRAFLLDEEYPWPEDLKEEWRLMKSGSFLSCFPFSVSSALSAFSAFFCLSVFSVSL